MKVTYLKRCVIDKTIFPQNINQSDNRTSGILRTSINNIRPPYTR